MMDLTKLFEIQAKLDQHIMDNHPELKESNNLPWKILAFQVELGECANEWRGFKKWSNDKEPRVNVEIPCEVCNGSGRSYSGYCGNCHGGYVGARNFVLEEYVDCLHFLLSIGIEIDCTNIEVEFLAQEDNIIDSFLSVFEHCTMMDIMPSGQLYANLFGHFVSLGAMLGFTWEQIEQAYYEKNKINHERQNTGY